MVPRSRLIWLAALMIAPFAGLGATAPEIVLLSGVLVVAAAVLVLVDGILGIGGLRGVGIELPGVVRMLKDRQGVISVRMKNESQKPRQIRLGLPLPQEIRSPEESRLAVLLPGSECSRLSWVCTAARRGRYRLGRCHLEGTSPMGFWAVRSQAAADTEIRVYPNLFPERKLLAPLFLQHGPAGAHAQRQLGRGRDFEKLRHYSPGDSYDEIHWKATAKRRFPITKVFQMERTQEVYVIVDASRLSTLTSPSPDRPPMENGDTRRSEGLNQGPGPGAETTLERFVTAALVLGLAAEQQGDLFGLMTFSDRVHGFLRARNGKGHYGACRDMLYTLQPRVISPNFDDLCSFIGLKLRRRAMLVFLTSLDDPALAEGFVRNVGVLCRRHLAVVGMLQPPGARPLFAAGDVASVDDLYRRLGGHFIAENLKELGGVLHRLGARFCLLENEKMSAQLVAQYNDVKRRQLL